MLEACRKLPASHMPACRYRWRARQKDGRQVMLVDVDRDDVAYLEEIGLLGGLEPREHRAGARPAFAGVPEARRRALMIQAARPL
jgi:hypothetical protein